MADVDTHTAAGVTVLNFESNSKLQLNSRLKTVQAVLSRNKTRLGSKLFTQSGSE